METNIHRNGDRYIVTGMDRDGRRFRRTFDLPQWALGINLWRGSVWQERNGKRRLLKRVTN